MGAFPCQCRFLVCVGRVFGNHLLWVLVAARAGPAGAGGVFALRRSVPERPARERLSVSRLLRPFTRARPRFGLCVASGGPCTSGCIRLAGEVGCEQSRVTTGPPCPANDGPLCRSQAAATDDCGGFGLGEAPGATAGACGGCPRCAAPVSSWWVIPHAVWEP